MAFTRLLVSNKGFYRGFRSENICISKIENPYLFKTMTLVAKLFSETGSPTVQTSRKYLRVKAVNFTGVNYWVERCSEKFRVLLKRGNGKRKTENYSAETCRGNAPIFRRIGFPFPSNSAHIFLFKKNGKCDV